MGSKFTVSVLLVVALYVYGTSATYYGGVGIGAAGDSGFGGYSQGWDYWVCTCRRYCFPGEILLLRSCIFPPGTNWKGTCCRRIRGNGGGYGGIGGGEGAGYFGGFGYGGADGYGYRLFPAKGSSGY